MSITKQRWQLTRCDSTLEHFSSTQIKLLPLELEHPSVELQNFEKTYPLFSFILIMKRLPKHRLFKRLRQRSVSICWFSRIE